MFTASEYKQTDRIAELFNTKLFHSIYKVNWVEGIPF
jgi:hypothetical protein